MIFEEVEPIPVSRTAKEWRENNPEKVKAYRKTETFQRAKKKNAKKKRDEAYLTRPFIAWDGEGVTDPSTGKHYYNMLANSMGKSIGKKNRNGKYSGLETLRILKFLCEAGKEFPESIHIIYGGGYDFNMFLKDLNKDEIAELYSTDTIMWKGFQIKWRRGRSFEVKNAMERNSKAIVIYDVLPFFQTSFVKACDSYLGDNFLHRDVIVEQKANRGTFTREDYKLVAQYNQYELDNLVSLAVELRKRLDKVGIRIKRWDGPGAIAAELLSRYNIQDYMAEPPTPVAEAARFAYSGGRFEIVKMGVSDEPVYEYDINSAYPYALQFLPNLRNGKWKHYTGDYIPYPKKRETFALYHAFYSEPDNSTHSWKLGGRKHPRPLFKRVANGNIFYPEKTFGWFWASEIFEAIEYCKRYPGELTILECWVFIENDPTDKPFSFVPELYAERQRLKAAGDGANVGLKLGLNSMYGKLAQQVGWQIDRYTKQLRKPPFHQLEWAGFTTAMCRSLVLHAAIDCLENVVAYETDALFVTKRLTHLQISSELGDWEETIFENLSYIQSGFYFGTIDGKQIVRSRGVDKDSIDREGVEKSFLHYGSYEARSSRFVTAGQALYQNWDDWTTWQTNPREITAFTPHTKRIHSLRACTVCRAGLVHNFKFNEPDSDYLERGWHDTITGVKAVEDEDEHNVEYAVEWIDIPETKEMKEENRLERIADYEQMSLFDENGAF